MLPFIVCIVEVVWGLGVGETKRTKTKWLIYQLTISQKKKLLQNYPKMWFTSYNLDFHSDLHLHCIHALIVKNGNNEDNAKRLKKLFS